MNGLNHSWTVWSTPRQFMITKQFFLSKIAKKTKYRFKGSLIHEIDSTVYKKTFNENLLKCSEVWHKWIGSISEKIWYIVDARNQPSAHYLWKDTQNTYILINKQSKIEN